MNAAFAIGAMGASLDLPAQGLRLFQIVGDIYEPEFRRGDFLMVAPARRFTYDTDYLLDCGYGETPYLATSSAAGVTIRRRNPLYQAWELTMAEFNEAVRAIVVAEVKVRDERLIQQTHYERVAA